jgi:hypothetical protein
VSGDREYRVGKRRLRSPDVAVATPPTLVLIEVYSGRVPLPARTRGDIDSVELALEKMLLRKLTELQARVGDVIDGHVRLPGVGDHVTRIYPVLVLAGEGVLQTSILRAWIDARLPHGAFGDPRVTPPTICDLDDLDPLLALVERGHTLADLFDTIQSGPYAELPPRNWVSAVKQPAADDRPRYVEAQFEPAMRAVHGRLFPASDRFDELWEQRV